jgi:hypothetical protein
MTYTQNPNRVTPPVLTRSSILAALGVLAPLGSALGMDADQTNRLVDALVVILPVLGTVAGAVWGSLKARDQVTPVLPGDTPRDQQGNALEPVSHTPAAGYPTRADHPGDRYTRAATPEERPRPPFETP